MRHGKKFNHLSRQKGHRAAMLANMACSLIEHKRINTTVAKAKALKQFVEPLITKSKEDTTHNRRICFSYLRSKYAVTDLFRDVAAKVGDRPGGYTRIIKVGNRLGDNADMAMIELVDFNELYNGGKKEEKKSKSRRGGKSKGATTAPAAAPTRGAAESSEAKAAPVAEVPEAEVEGTPVAETPVAEAETPIEEAIDETPVAEVETPEATTEADSSVSEQAEQSPEAPDAEDNTEEKAE
jgi:large subunit ribosomal protein L17